MFESVKRGMANTRAAFTERMNVLLDRGPDVDEDFWEGLEEALILSDVGAETSFKIVEDMREVATRKALPDAYAVMDALAERIAETFTNTENNLFDEKPVCVLFVGINGAGKTTTVGKIAAEQKAKGRNVLLGSGDTFRAAAIEQLEEWSKRANVEIVQRERGADPASVCYDTIERAEAAGSDLVLIDTAGRLHTSDDLMRELQKVVNVVRKRANMPVRCVLVIDATTGQNGLSQAQQFNKALDLDAVIVTKLDGTAKGGIALAVSSELGLPIAKVGVGESLEDLQDFDAFDFSAALIGAEPEYVLVDEDGTEHVVSREEFEAEDSVDDLAEPVASDESQDGLAEPAVAGDSEDGLAEPAAPAEDTEEVSDVTRSAAQDPADPSCASLLQTTTEEDGMQSDMDTPSVSSASSDADDIENKEEEDGLAEPVEDEELERSEEAETGEGLDDEVDGVAGDEEAESSEEDEEGLAEPADEDEVSEGDEEKPQEGRMKRLWKWLGSTD